METAEFVFWHLPPAPARVLEVGCGDGRLALEMATGGYAVTAVDPDAPEGPVFRRTAFEDFAEPGPFEAVVASRSLHHIEGLDEALAKVHGLLGPAGVVIVNEFAWERLDRATARWYLAHAGDEGTDPDAFVERWRKEHDELHRSDALLAALRTRFVERWMSREPYLARYYFERPDLEAEERARIERGEIRALGFRYVGVR